MTTVAKLWFKKAYFNTPADPPDTRTEQEREIEKNLNFNEAQNKHIGVLLARERDKQKAANERQAAELEKYKNQFKGTAEEKKALEERIESLRTEFASKEEIAQREYKATTEKVTAELNAKTKEAEAFKQKYETFRTNNELLAAASSAGAYRGNQIVAMFAGQTKIVPVFDKDGKDTGSEEVKVRVSVDGKEYETTPTEAMKLLKGSKDYANLFVSEGTGGLGLGKSGDTGKLDLQRAATDPAYYRANREQILASDRK